MADEPADDETVVAPAQDEQAEGFVDDGPTPEAQEPSTEFELTAAAETHEEMSERSDEAEPEASVSDFEAVEDAESASDISDKVDRLLEELREVT
jgi:hypothetical protein